MGALQPILGGIRYPAGLIQPVFLPVSFIREVSAFDLNHGDQGRPGTSLKEEKKHMRKKAYRG